jgi:hypothetical protein
MTQQTALRRDAIHAVMFDNGCKLFRDNWITIEDRPQFEYQFHTLT